MSSKIEHGNRLIELAGSPDLFGLDLKAILTTFSSILQKNKTLSRTEIARAGEKLLAWRNEKRVGGLWTRPPVMLTATLDDAIGQGLQIIHQFSRLAGVDVRELGLMRSPAAIVEQCHRQKPDMLGMTILQFHTEETLCDIVNTLPPAIEVVVGGPIFNTMEARELEHKGYRVLNDIRRFIDFLLTLTPRRPSTVTNGSQTTPRMGP